MRRGAPTTVRTGFAPPAGRVGEPRRLRQRGETAPASRRVSRIVCGNRKVARAELLSDLGLAVHVNHSDLRDDKTRAADVKAALARGCSIDDKRLGQAPLIMAAWHGMALTCRALLDAGADVKALNSISGWSALMYAASEGKIDVVALLLLFGADVTIVDPEGRDAFFIAGDSETSNAATIKLLEDAEVAANPAREQILAGGGCGGASGWLLESMERNARGNDSIELLSRVVSSDCPFESEGDRLYKYLTC